MENKQDFFAEKELELQKEIINRLKKIEDPVARLEFLCNIKPAFQMLSNSIAAFKEFPNEQSIESQFGLVRTKLLK